LDKKSQKNNHAKGHAAPQGSHQSRQKHV